MLEDIRFSPDKVLTRLEENLNLLLFDLSDQKRTIDHFDLAVGEYRPTLFVCRHRNCGFYEDFQKERKDWATEKQKLKEEIEKLHVRTAESKVYKEELIKLQNAFTSTSEDGNAEIRFRLGELSRELTMQRVNELALLRRYAGSQEVEVVLREEIRKLKNRLVQVESMAQMCLSYYSRCTEMASFQIDTLQKQLDICISREEYDRLADEYETLSTKCREILCQSFNSSEGDKGTFTAGADFEKLRQEYELLANQWTAKTQASTPEHDWKSKEPLENKPGELRKFNKRGLEEQLLQVFNKVWRFTEHLVQKNQKLEQKLSMQMRRKELAPNSEPTKAVPDSVHQTWEKRSRVLERENLKLHHENEQLKEVAVISLAQLQNAEQQQATRDLELESLRKQLVELEAKDDGTAKMVRLHRMITQLQISESNAVANLTAEQTKNNRLQSLVIKLQQRLVAKDADLGKLHEKLRCGEITHREAVQVLNPPTRTVPNDSHPTTKADPYSIVHLDGSGGDPHSIASMQEQLIEARWTADKVKMLMSNIQEKNDFLERRNAEFVRELQNVVNQNAPVIHNEDSAGESAVLAPGVQATLELLQKRLVDKEESLEKAKQLLRQVYEANVNVNQLRKKEMEEIQTQLNHKISETIRQLSTTVENGATKPRKDSSAPVLMQRLQQLELALEEQNEAIIRQSERSKSMQQESQLWKLQFQQLQVHAQQDRKTLEDSYKQKLRKLFLAYRQLRSDVEERDKKIDELQTELAHWKQEARKSPSMMQRQMNERLKAELTEKNKQLQTLSRALVETRRELISQAEEAVLAATQSPRRKSLKNKEKPESLKEADIADQAILQIDQSHLVVITNLNQRAEELELKCRQLQAEVKQVKKLQEKREQIHKTEQADRERLLADIHLLKTQIASKSSAVDQLQSQLESVSVELERTTRENISLREQLNKFAVLQPQLDNPDLYYEQSEKQYAEQVEHTGASRRSGPILESAALNSSQQMDSDAHNRITNDRIKYLEQELLDRGFTSLAKLKMDRDMQNDRLRLIQENIARKSELEAAREEIPQLKKRVNELQALVDKLKNQKNDGEVMQNPDESMRSLDNITGNNARKTGVGEKTTREMEETIMRLKRVLRRTVAENEKLKQLLMNSPQVKKAGLQMNAAKVSALSRVAQAPAGPNNHQLSTKEI
ncbi:Centrosomal protein of 290 kDa [Clonorchis sinensis]|uniref:Centrosomal protein of 290 kDa n=1 Tax=Clonorchis sinensis TaxID=79923 RepID=A0A8T1M1T3_CLOSI|nr:Centrosomal protein of 290 kDa [Clonorchis sinensis]